MSKEQTAVDFLFKKLWDEPKDKFTWFALLKQAKKLHEKQIVSAWQEGYRISDIDTNRYNTGREFSSETPEKYYNETYGDEQA